MAQGREDQRGDRAAAVERVCITERGNGQLRPRNPRCGQPPQYLIGVEDQPGAGLGPAGTQALQKSESDGCLEHRTQAGVCADLDHLLPLCANLQALGRRVDDWSVELLERIAQGRGEPRPGECCVDLRHVDLHRPHMACRSAGERREGGMLGFAQRAQTQSVGRCAALIALAQPLAQRRKGFAAEQPL